MRLAWIVMLCGVAAASNLFADAADSPGPGWRFVLPEQGADFEHPPLRAVLWSDSKPEDVNEEAVEYRGRKRRYAQLRFGSPNSTRIVVVLDEVSAAEGDLYVDANRDRHLTPAEKVAGAGPHWRVPLRVEHVVEDTVEHERRAIVLRRGTAGLTLGLAAVGFWEGRVRLGDRDVTARRVDGDGNGLFADPLDRLWIDLNDDSRWDAGREQFLFAPLLMLNGSRFAVRGDVLGRHLTLEPVTGTGTVRLAWTGSTTASRCCDWSRATTMSRF